MGVALKEIVATQTTTTSAVQPRLRSVRVSPRQAERNMSGEFCPRLIGTMTNGVRHSALTASTVPAWRFRCASLCHSTTMPPTRAAAARRRMAMMPHTRPSCATSQENGSACGGLTNATSFVAQFVPGGRDPHEWAPNSGFRSQRSWAVRLVDLIRVLVRERRRR